MHSSPLAGNRLLEVIDERLKPFFLPHLPHPLQLPLPLLSQPPTLLESHFQVRFEKYQHFAKKQNLGLSS